MRQTRRGFTLIELLVVIGIILILVGLLVAGYRHLNRTAANKETIAELHICRGLLQDYENHDGLQGIEFFAPSQTADSSRQTPPNGLTPNQFPVYLDPVQGTTTASQWPSIPLPPKDLADSSGKLTDVGSKAAGSARYCPAVLKTLDVMYVLMRIPSNQTTVQSIQSKRIMEPIPSGSGASAAIPISQGAVLLDGWGNPIIFVPRAGLHVNITQPGTTTVTPYVVRSTGTFNASNGDPPMTGNERPFWASAGQDGDFSQGEDNVYSFQD